MELNSIEEVEGYAEIKVENRIRYIEKKLLKLSYTPFMLLAAIIILTIITYGLSENLGSSGIIFPIGLLIFSVDRINVQRTDLLKELFQLKYEK